MIDNMSIVAICINLVLGRAKENNPASLSHTFRITNLIT